VQHFVVVSGAQPALAACARARLHGTKPRYPLVLNMIKPAGQPNEKIAESSRISIAPNSILEMQDGE
jgi:hypothetical protein